MVKENVLLSLEIERERTKLLEAILLYKSIGALIFVVFPEKLLPKELLKYEKGAFVSSKPEGIGNMSPVDDSLFSSKKQLEAFT